MEIIRNLTRRKLRTTLTISGIVIGVLASPCPSSSAHWRTSAGKASST